MNKLIETADAGVIGVYEGIVPRVAALPPATLEDLAHECESLAADPEWSVRTGAHLVRAAVVMEVERRKGK